MSKSNQTPDNWVFCSPDGKYGGLLFNVPRSEVEQAALLALDGLSPETDYQEVKYTRYKGSTLVLAFRPTDEDEGVAEVILGDMGTTKALYEFAEWPINFEEE